MRGLSWWFDILDLRTNCECCDVDLPPDSNNAMICSFECTFCKDCVSTVLKWVCPNCGGNLLQRPTQDKKWLAEK